MYLNARFGETLKNLIRPIQWHITHSSTTGKSLPGSKPCQTGTIITISLPNYNSLFLHAKEKLLKDIHKPLVFHGTQDYPNTE